MLKQIKEELAKTLSYLTGTQKFEGETKIYQPEEINISERAIGGKVEMVNTDGTLSAMPDGAIELSDGFKCTIKDGLITAIEGEEAIAEQSEEMADEAPAEEPKSDSSAIDEMKKITDELREEINVMKAALDELKASMSDTANKDEVANFNKQFSDLNETIKKVVSAPAEFSKTTKSNVAKDKNEQGKIELARIFKNLN